MPLYRADYIDREGTILHAVGDWRGDLLTRHMTTIRKRASEAALAANLDVLISRIVKAGSIKGTLVATADGRFRKPDGMKVTDRGGEHKTEGACFCPACRADRAEKRKRAIQHDPLETEQQRNVRALSGMKLSGGRIVPKEDA